MKMTKRMICLIVACVAVASVLFLPLMTVSVSMMGQSISESANFFDALDGGLFEEFCSIAWLLAIIAGAGAIYGAAVKKDKNITFIASAVAAVLMLLSLITLPDAPVASYEISGGIGLWIALLGFAATAVMVKVFDKEWDDEQ